MQRFPINGIGRGQCVERPSARAVAFAKRQFDVVEQDGKITAMRLVDKRDEIGPALGGGREPQRLQRKFFVPDRRIGRGVEKIFPSPLGRRCPKGG